MTRKLLIIGYVWPEPNSSAAGTRMMQLINLFKSQQWAITFASPALPSEHRQKLEPLGIKEKSIPLNDSRFDDFISKLKPDVVLFDRFMMEEQFGWRVEKHCPEALRLLNTEDLHSLRQARHEQFKKTLKSESDSLERLWNPSREALFLEMTEQEQTKREIASILRSDQTLMISGFETDLLEKGFRIDRKLLFTLPFIYPKPKQNHLCGFSERKHFVFIGNFRHAPNWDAVLWLKQKIWPGIRRSLPEAELHIYGAYPAKKVTDLHNPQQGFHIKGWAESARDVLIQARVCLAPLRFGAGIKGKLVESMLFGTPSITTPIGCEGMLPAGETEWPGSVCLTETEIIHQAVNHYQNRSSWTKSHEKASELALSRFCQTEPGDDFMRQLEGRLKTLDLDRKRNFTGAMLRHHHHKSTQYMAQWIEAKNRLNPENPDTKKGA